MHDMMTIDITVFEIVRAFKVPLPPPPLGSFTFLNTPIGLVYRPGYFTVHPPPAPSGPKSSNSENCCGSENAMPPKIFWDMEGHRGHFRSKNDFFSKKHILENIHNKSHYFF